MAEFILGSPLKPLARRFPRLRRALWRLDEGFVRALLALFRRLPVDAASRLGARVGGLIGPRLRSKNQLLRENLAIAFPDCSRQELDALVLGCWRQGGRILAEYPHLERFASAGDRIEIDTSLCDPATRQPCVVVSAHLSNWELNASALCAMNIANASLYSPPSNPYLDRLLLDSRAALNNQLLPRDRSARLLLRALKGGRSVGVVVDRRVDDGESVEFFGHAKATSLLPARLALKQGCALIPSRVQRLRDARFRVTFYPPIEPPDPTADEHQRAIDMMQQLHRQFESWIREQPAEWLCSKRLWPRGTNPAAAAVQSPGTRRYNTRT